MYKYGTITDSIFQNLSWRPIKVDIRLPNYRIEVWRSKTIIYFLTISISAHTTENIIRDPQLSQFWDTVTIEIFLPRDIQFLLSKFILKGCYGFL